MKKENTRDFSSFQEKQIAKKLKGKVQSNSGGTRFGGGDVHTKSFLIEAKTPTKSQSSISVQQEWLKKAKEQSFAQAKPYYAVAIRFDPDGPDYYVIDERVFKQFVEYLEGGEEL